MVPWGSGVPSEHAGAERAVAEVGDDPDPSGKQLVSGKRGSEVMAAITSSFTFSPGVRQVVGEAGFVDLYCEEVAEDLSLCKRWKCKSFKNPLKNAKFSGHANEFDTFKVYGFCERCHNPAVASRVGERRSSASVSLQPHPSGPSSAVASVEESSSSSSNSDSETANSDNS